MLRHLTRALACALSLTAVTAAGVAGAIPASAAHRGSVGVAVGHFDSKVPGSMGHFILTLAPGATYADDVVVTNPDDTPFSIYAYPADAGTSDASGEYYGIRSDPLRKAGAWVTSPVSSLTIPAKGQTRVPFTVNVPPDATPGDHLAAMVFEPQNAADGPGAMGVGAVWRAAMPILVQVPGPGGFHVALSSAAIQPREGTGTSTVVIGVANDGNRKGKPILSVRLLGPHGYDRTEPAPDCAGHGDGRFCGHLDYVLPGDAIHFPFPWTGDLPAGDYTIIVTGSWGPGADESVMFTAASHLGSALRGTPLIPPQSPAKNGGIAGISDTGGFWGWLGRLGKKAFLITIVLALTVFTPLLVLLLKRRRCTHCRKYGLLGRFTAQDYNEIAVCGSCRAKAKERVKVVLCRDCYRTHVRTVTLGEMAPAR